jgi:lipopolysaccharide transport system ATP-binding protein
MSRPIIEVRNLSKRYRLGTIGATSLREEFHRYVDRFRGVAHPDEKEFWALRDVSFDVQAGEVVGVIGRNGAGKSTLLKILSRITEPTSGQARLRGRVASLLEVGTGFHPELTGRENVFLNGAILGMSRAEVRRKLDEIIAFAEVEQFIDTPVKRYSSGMYVRLAFAVAAHLEPEILIVDEVLAVGDVAFQSKCLGKMREVATESGRTVLFVSHNFDAVLRLCRDVIWLDGGRCREIGPAPAIVRNYQHSTLTLTKTVDLERAQRVAVQRGRARLSGITCRTSSGTSGWNYPFGAPLEFDCDVTLREPLQELHVAFAVFSTTGFEIASTRREVLGGARLDAGRYRIALSTPHLRLAPGNYRLNLGLRSEHGDEDYIDEGPSFEVSTNRAAADLMADTMRGACIPETTSGLTRLS